MSAEDETTPPKVNAKEAERPVRRRRRIARPGITLDFLRAHSLINLTRQEVGQAIVVSRISSSVSLRELYDFFSFSGPIAKIWLFFDDSPQIPEDAISVPNLDLLIGIVVFGDSESHSTACMLRGCRLGGALVGIFPMRRCLRKPSQKPRERRNVLEQTEAVLERVRTEISESAFGKKVTALRQSIADQIQSVDTKIGLSRGLKTAGERMREGVRRVRESEGAVRVGRLLGFEVPEPSAAAAASPAPSAANAPSETLITTVPPTPEASFRPFDPLGASAETAATAAPETPPEDDGEKAPAAPAAPSLDFDLLGTLNEPSVASSESDQHSEPVEPVASQDRSSSQSDSPTAAEEAEATEATEAPEPRPPEPEDGSLLLADFDLTLSPMNKKDEEDCENLLSFE